MRNITLYPLNDFKTPLRIKHKIRINTEENIFIFRFKKANFEVIGLTRDPQVRRF